MIGKWRQFVHAFGYFVAFLLLALAIGSRHLLMILFKGLITSIKTHLSDDCRHLDVSDGNADVLKASIEREESRYKCIIHQSRYLFGLVWEDNHFIQGG